MQKLRRQTELSAVPTSRREIEAAPKDRPGLIIIDTDSQPHWPAYDIWYDDAEPANSDQIAEPMWLRRRKAGAEEKPVETQTRDKARTAILTLRNTG